MAAQSSAGAHLRLVSAVPATQHQTSAGAPPDLGERELKIGVRPRGYDWWRGTSAQLQAEGVIPADFQWPVGKERMLWVAGRFEFWLFRCPPDGHKGPQSSWLALDHWACRRTLAAHGRDGFAAARLHEKQVAIANELWSQTPEARAQLIEYRKAARDESFQAFKAMIPGLVPPKRARKAKAAATTAQGAQQ